MTNHFTDEFALLQSAVVEALEEEELRAESSESAPHNLFLVPLTKRPLFPGMAAPLVIEPGAYYEVLKLVAKTKHKCIGLVLTRSEDTSPMDVRFKELHSVGVLAKILRIIPIEQGGAQVIVNVERRISLHKEVKSSTYLMAKVTEHQDPLTISDELKAYSINIVTTIKELLKLNPLFKEELQVFLGHSDFTEPGKLADFSVTLTCASRDELQDVLETFDIQSRIDKALLLLKKELDLSKLQSSINQKVEGRISKTQKEFFLREQLKTIKKELGVEKDDKTSALAKFEERLKTRLVPQDTMRVIQEELSKLASLEPSSSEYAVCRSYLDWLTIIPWGITGQQSHTLKEAKGILQEDHWGLDDIKERILECISVNKLTQKSSGSILCLVGPPGVGKTSIGKSIARALGRKFFRFSVGGMKDEAEIKGHRRTYVGAMPGKLIQALKLTQVMNPVIMLDEVDKLSSSYHGDPASALLEVLDPEQNKEFLDHYLDVRCDLSQVLFLVTANMLDTIPEPLKDRMDILRLPGYIQEEKVEIAQRYLIPKQRKEMGLKPSWVRFAPGAVEAIISGYAREAGVRGLENNIKKILRKIAHKVVQKEEDPSQKTPKTFLITKKNLHPYIGKPVFTQELLYPKTPIGIATGLAWTAMGGVALAVEAIATKSARREMKLTGQAGDVMKESSQIAWSYLHSKVQEFTGSSCFFDKECVHIHIPEGATPKDGPSAGITMASALLSLLTDQPIRPDIGMTGELTLTGKVLAIGGVREKLIAARRAGLQAVIFPKDNERDFDELPAYLKEGIQIHFVGNYEEVHAIAFPKSSKKRIHK